MAAQTVIQPGLVRRRLSCQPWHARAFGVDLELRFDAPALRSGEQAVASDPTVLELVYAASLDARWRPAEAQALGGMADQFGRPLLDIREHPELGIMFRAGRHGRYLISRDARHVACAPPSVAEWYWQRILIGQILPLVAALRGLHVLHASAVSLGDRAVAIAGPPGAGKSTLAAEFALRGNNVVAEDVVALRLDDRAVLAEPGVSLLSLRPSDSAEATVVAAPGRVLGRSHKIHIDVPRAPRALPLSAFYLLERGTSGGPTIERLPAPSVPDLMADSFVPYLRRPEDLLRHLDFSAAIAQTVEIARVRVDGNSSTALADEIEQHAGGRP